MDELFAPPGAPWRGVSPALAWQRRLAASLLAFLTLVAELVLVAVLEAPAWVAAVAAVAVVAGGVLAWWLVGRNVRCWGYAERDEDLYIKHGALFRKLVVVPYGRMQYVDVHAGPLEQAFGVASVRLHTASPGTSARIPGLPAAEASRLRDRLTELGQAQAAGL
jgi:membrane protein YdbS with pleckstrin-like domain